MWPFKKKPEFIEPQKESEAESVSYPDQQLDLQLGKLVFLGTVPFYITAIVPKKSSITLKRLTQNQFKRLQERAKELSLAAAKKSIDSSSVPTP